MRPILSSGLHPKKIDRYPTFILSYSRFSPALRGYCRQQPKQQIKRGRHPLMPALSFACDVTRLTLGWAGKPGYSAGMRLSAHPIVIDTLRRRSVQAERTVRQMPLVMRQSRHSEGLAELRQTFIVFMKDVNFHELCKYTKKTMIL